MKTRLTISLCVAALLAVPGVASAALALQIGQNAGSVDDFHFGPGWGQPGQVQYLDLIFTETGTPATEDLSTYDIGVLLTRPMGRGPRRPDCATHELGRAPGPGPGERPGG